MNLKDFKIDLPTNWREISRFGTENQSSIKIYHISPLSKVDPDIRENKILPSSNPRVTITRESVPVPRGAPMPIKDYYESMKVAISCGLLSADWTKKIDKLHKDSIKLHCPDDGDFDADIVIAQFQSEEIAKQYFKNMSLMPTQGFDVPMPMGKDTQMPGAPKDLTIYQYLKDFDKYLSKEFLEKYVPKEQLEKMEPEIFEKIKESKPEIKKMQSELKNIQEKKIPEIKKQFLSSGVQYKEGKYLGCDVIYMESKNYSPPPKPKSSSQKSSGIRGGGGLETRFDPLPKIHQPYQKTLIIYQALLIKNFVITGSLLSIINASLPGITPCYSLTKFKKKISTFREGGEVFKDISIVPIVSNYAKEGYLYKEEVEEILKKIIAKLSKNEK
ncbi:MAG: hypothetical protein WC579_00295 [Candidatus Paceibacterota bacterium]|nr:hypothetical protein [Candidatus Paceibacterota bacterium]HQM35006.1 hypothetical protein [Candidatus Paceibacterota bacterium]